MGEKTEYYDIDIKFDFWGNSAFGSFKTLEEAKEFMETHWRRNEYRIHKITKELVFDKKPEVVKHV